MRSKVMLILASVLLVSLLPTTNVAADTGPKPTMEFEFVQPAVGPPLSITSGTLYECDQPDCSDAKPLIRGGPQGLYCDQTSCRALAYGFRTYHRLQIKFSDGKTRQSNVFETAGFDSKYKVTIGDEDLLVESTTNSARLTTILVSLACCFVVLLIIAAIALLVWFIVRKK